jgi:hypothetical protein
MNDYRLIFPEDQHHLLDVRGRFCKENFEQNEKMFNNLQRFRELSETKQIWQIPYLRDPYHEDNDTSDEASDEDEDSGSDEEMKDQIQIFLKQS